MIVFPRRKNRIRGVAHVMGGGFGHSGAGIFDWLGNIASKAGNFVNNNSSLIKGVASTIADVGKAAASSATSVKQIVDLARQRKLTTPEATVVPPQLASALNQKSVDILNNLITSSTSAGAGVYLGKASDGYGLYLGKASDGWGIKK